jgi:hypothetical protein
MASQPTHPYPAYFLRYAQVRDYAWTTSQWNYPAPLAFYSLNAVFESIELDTTWMSNLPSAYNRPAPPHGLPAPAPQRPAAPAPQRPAAPALQRPAAPARDRATSAAMPANTSVKGNLNPQKVSLVSSLLFVYQVPSAVMEKRDANHFDYILLSLFLFLEKLIPSFIFLQSKLVGLNARDKAYA